uniref:chitin synthase n=1 Tax=Crassostrea virginica TaxID=6565 RepID=A0A8B8DBZ3_CRAVI|nr:uncharacterized protein LOC111125208 isoform X3 [Crassostrea virginica]
MDTPNIVSKVWTPDRLRKIYEGFDGEPQKHKEGPYLNRNIPLPMDTTYKSTENLIPKHGDNITPNGIVNPAMSDVNSEVPSWSDTSSENIKGNSRASTLTRETKSDDLGSPEKTINIKEAKEKSNSFPRYTSLSSHNEPLKDPAPSASLPTKSSSLKPWDVFRTGSRDISKTIDGNYVSLFRKCTKVVVSIVLTILILILTMISKSSLLLITSNVYSNVTLKCNKSDKPGHVSSCSRVAPDVQDGAFQPSQSVEVTWLWALFLVTTTPYVFTFAKCVWRICFKNTRNPTFTVLIITLSIETLHSIGICIFIFYVLPNMDPIRGLMLTFGVAFVPSFLKMFDSQRETGRQFYIVVADLLAMLIQASVLLLWPLLNIIRGIDYEQSWGIFVSLLLISLGWWENYVNRFTHLGKFGMSLLELKRNIRRSRTKLYAAVSVWKVVLTLGMMLALMSNLRLSCVKALLYEGRNRAKECPHLVYPEDANNAESTFYKQDAFWVAAIQIICCLICYTLAKSACKIMLQVVSFSLPLMLAAPIMAGLFIENCESWKTVHGGNIMPDYLYWTCDIHGVSADFLRRLVSEYYLPITLIWWLSFMWVTFHIWIPRVERLVQTERLFVQPLYCGVLLEQSLMLNRRRDDRDRDFRLGSEKHKRFGFESPEMKGKYDGILPGRRSIKTDRTPMIYVCATMWHETQKEMMQILTSLFRLDNDQCARKNAQKFFDVVDPDYYEFEIHVFFDDAFEPHEDDEYLYRVNSFVKQLLLVMDSAASKVHKVPVKLPPPTKYPTPYGGRLEWTLPGGNKMNVHMKDKAKIRHKKRWSQVMYMYYLLGYKLVAQPLDARRKQTIADNTFILALDGDVDFKPSAVQLLVDRMRKNEKVGAACGRIHPIGTGPMIWYQKFEYAVSHWLQKATEHLIGCVLCSPGCFSLFRGSALMDDNVMRKYATLSSNARHYIQFDQGEDRWLCTLLLQQGYRVEYSAAADALTYAPEGFGEFYNQRRRWSPSTMANIMDLLMDWRNVININENISFLYIMYQGLLFLSSIVTPGTIFLLIVGAMTSAFKIELMVSFGINIAPLLLFLISCYLLDSKWQILFAMLLSLIYSLLMMVVVVGIGLEMKSEGLCSPTTIFMIFVIGTFVIAAILHPQEFYCIIHGALYFMCIPSMSMLLMIYSICNLHVVSWGTRENAIAAQPNAKPEKKKNGKIASILNKFSSTGNSEDSEYAFSFGNLFKCLCCPKTRSNDGERRFEEVLNKLEDLERIMARPKDIQEKLMVDAETNVSEDDVIADNSNNVKTPHENGDVRYNPLYQTKFSPHEEDTPFWIHDDDIGHGRVRFLSKEEKSFWSELISKYLYPLQHNAKHKKQMETDLLEMRNKMSLMFFMMNALFIIIIFSLQYANTQNKAGLSIPLPCYDLNNTQLSIEPISLLFMAIFGIALLIQFISMFFHRLATFMHIMSTTEVNCMKPNQNEINQMDLASKISLVKEFQKYEDDEDTRSISTIGSDLDEDSSITQDDSPKLKRKKTVINITRRKRIQNPHLVNLSGNVLKNFMEFAKDLENGKTGGKNEKRSTKKRRSKKAKKAMDSLEQNKDMVLKKAHVIKSRWHRIAKATKFDSTGDKWGSLLRLATQSRTSLNTITEDDKRNSWIRGISNMTRSNSEFSVNTLPDLGSFSQRNSYAEPILNIITSDLENVDSGYLGRQVTTAEINSLQRSRFPAENHYDAVEEVDSDSGDSDYEEADGSSSRNSSSPNSTGDNQPKGVEMRTINADVIENKQGGETQSGDTHL